MLNLKSHLGPALVLALGLPAGQARANVIFNFLPEPGMSQVAIDGFTAAANRWSATLADNIVINVQIGFSSLGAGIVGQAGSDYREFSYTDTRTALSSTQMSAEDVSAYASLAAGASYSRIINHTSNNPNGANSALPYLNSLDRVGMTTSNAKALGLLGASSSLDAVIRFNSDLGFDFDPADGITAGQFDFVGAATHELGHALGFVSGVDDLDQAGGALADYDFSSDLLDLFRFSAGSLGFGAGVTDYTADKRAKYFSTDGGASSIALFANGITFGDGRQASHWKDLMNIGLMDPAVFPGELMKLTDTDLRAFDVLGYTLVPEPSGVTLVILGLYCAIQVRRQAVMAKSS